MYCLSAFQSAGLSNPRHGFKEPEVLLGVSPLVLVLVLALTGLVVQLKNKKSLGGAGSRISLILVQTPGHPSIVRPRKRLVRRLVPSQS